MDIAFAAASLVERTGWLLVHSVWQFALIAIVLAVVLRVMRSAPAGARYAAALIGWGLMLAAPAVTWPLLPEPVLQGDIVAAPAPADPLPEPLSLPVDTSERLPTPAEAFDATVVRAANGIISAPAEVMTSPVWWAERLAARIAPWLNTLVVVWCVGVCLFGTRSARGWFAVQRLLRRDVVSVPDEMTTLLVSVLKRVGLTHRVRLLQSPHVEVPLVVGWLRPVILLPVCVATGFAPQQLEAILAHELAHIRRHDYLINLLQNLSETVFFYHPALWWASAVVRREREHCCDELAARALGNRAEYGRALLALEELRGTTPSLALGAKGGSLLERIRRLAQREPNPRLGVGGVIGLGFVAVLVLTAAVWTAGVAGEQAADLDSEQSQTDITGAGKSSNADAEGDPTKLARKALAHAAAIDRLPKFYLHAKGGTRTFKLMENAGDDPLANMLRALDEPVVEAEWYRYEPVFAWDEQHFLAGSESPNAYAPDQPEAKDPAGNPRSINYRWGTRELGAYRDEIVGRFSQCGFRKDAAAMWDDCFVSLNYYQVTPHQFWWGDTSHDNQTFSKLPTALAEYRMLEDAEFDGEGCHVVESPTRQERLWISQTSGLIRGYLHSSYHGPMTKFYESDVVTEIAGRKFASQHEYSSWYSSEYDKLPLEKRAGLQKAWLDTMDFSTAVPSLLVRFRDYREVAPGLWWPFREDRAQGHKSENGFECMRSDCAVDEIRFDLDLADRVQGLMPKEGEQVQDQRYAVPVMYKYSSALTEAEILKLVDAEYQKQLEGEETLKRLAAPYEKLLGQPALTLPETGWVGGKNPDVAGKPYLLHFWATWCGPCKNDLPILKRAAEDGAIIIGMHPSGTSADDVQTAIDENEMPYATFVETKDQPGGPGRTIAGYPADMFPYCVLIGADGRVAAHGGMMANNGEILAKFRDLRAANVGQADVSTIAAADDQSTTEAKAAVEDVKADDRVRITLIQAKLVLLLDGKQIVTWQEIDDRIAALPDPSRAYPQLYVTRGAREAQRDDAAQKEAYELHSKYKLSGHSVGSLTPRTDIHYDRIQTPADLVPDPALKVEGTVVDAAGKPVGGAEVVLITPVDESLPYKDYDIYVLSGRVRNPLDEVLAVTDQEGRFSVYPPQDTPFSVLALHPDAGIALVDGEQLRKEPKATLLKWGGIVAEFSQEPEQQSASLRTHLDATSTRPAIAITQYWQDLNRPDPTLEFEFTHVPPIWSTSISRDFVQPDGGSSGMGGATVSVLPNETRRITLGPVTQQQREFQKGIRPLLQPRAQAAAPDAPATAATGTGPAEPDAETKQKRADWVAKLLLLRKHNQTAFAIGPRMLVELEADAALAVTREAWPQIKVDEVKTGLLKTFEFDRHPQVLEVLDLGATDGSEEVRTYASGYLKNYAFRDFGGDREQYAAWRKEAAGKPVLEVIKANAEWFVNDQKSKTPVDDPRWWLELKMMLDVSGSKSSYPEKAAYLRDAGFVALLKKWADDPQAGPQVKGGAAELVKQIQEAVAAVETAGGEGRPAVEGTARSGDRPQPGTDRE